MAVITATMVVAHCLDCPNPFISMPPIGQPVVSGGIPLSKIHHAAFDAHLIGIDPDYRLHVCDRLVAQNDGPMLAALKRLQGNTAARRIYLTEIDSRCALSGSWKRAISKHLLSFQPRPLCPGSVTATFEGLLGRFMGTSWSKRAS